ncbi:MAG: type III-B CRISPR module-associated protein Cmr5 [Lentisphaerota bacterium]
MQNLEQIRAKNALEAANNKEYKFSGKNEGGVVKKIPAMIKDNGILATMAFSIETGGGYEDVFKAVIVHLGKKIDTKSFMKELASCNSSELRSITEETIAYLNYLRSFA